MELIRKKHYYFSPLYQLRKQKIFIDFIKPFFDFSVPIKLHNVSWKVYIKFLRDFSWVVNSKILNQELASLFLAIHKVYQPKTFWDVGANIGFFSWLLLDQNQEMQVVLFEPDPDNISLLQKTIDRANLSNVLLIDSAVSDRVGEASFAVDRVTGATGTLEVNEPAFIQRQYQINPSLINVKTISLDYILNKENIPVPDLIKIDVECSEDKVFEGANNLLQTHQPIIIFECSSQNKDKLLTRLHDLNYQLFDAESLTKSEQNLANAFNILALPVRFHYLTDRLFEAWYSESLKYSSKTNK
jgi:FkbM family methyltransferase